jgi:hypothetical protein
VVATPCPAQLGLDEKVAFSLYVVIGPKITSNFQGPVEKIKEVDYEVSIN